MKAKSETRPPPVDTKNLDLSGNRWQQLASFSNSLSVETLNLERNELTHVETASLPALPRLQSLDLTQNRLGSKLQLAPIFDSFPQLRVSTCTMPQ